MKLWQEKYHECLALEFSNPEYFKIHHLLVLAYMLQTGSYSQPWFPMKNANGCGLASPQAGLPIRLFVVGSKTTFENLEEADRAIFFDKNDERIMETFINARIIERSANIWEDEEGCLSIPNLSRKVERPWAITMEYYNRDFDLQTKTFSGSTARMIQHEYDHTEGILYLDYLKPLTRKLMESKLKKIVKGQIRTSYPMKFV